MAGGASCGQLLNGAGLIGLFDSFKPKFVKRYGNVGVVAVEVFSEFAAEVRSGVFPDDNHFYKMKVDEASKFQEALLAQE